MEQRTRISDLRERARRYLPFFLCLGGVALGLQAAGCGTRGWLIMDIAGTKIYTGLWEMEVCFTTPLDICVTNTLDNLENLSGGMWTFGMMEFRVETCLALALLVIALAVILSCTCCACEHGHVKGGVYCAFVMALISGILALIASGKFGNDVKKTHDLYNNLVDESPIKVPYSVILTGVGGILAIILAFVLLFVLKPWQRDVAEPPPAYPMHQSPQAVVYPPSQSVHYAGQPGTAYAVPYSGSHHGQGGNAPSGGKPYDPRYEGQQYTHDLGYGRKY